MGGLFGLGDERKTVRAGVWGTRYSFETGVFEGEETIQDCCKLVEFEDENVLEEFAASVLANVVGTWKNVAEFA